MNKTLLEIIDYFHFLIISTNRHGIHSPFIYSFADSILYQKTEENFEFIENQRLLMIQSKAKFNNTTLSKFTTNATLSAKYGRLLYRMALAFKPDSILEFGKNNGIALNYILSAAIKQNFQLSIYYDCKIQDSDDTIKSKSIQLFNEFHHTDYSILPVSEAKKELTKNWIILYGPDFWEGFDGAKSYLMTHSVVIVSQIRQTNDSYLQWQQMTNMKEVTASIELFNLGILFFRTEQPKQHFILRY